MTTTIAFANTNDAYLFSGSTVYSTALAGPADGVSSVSDTTLFIGQQKSGSTFTIFQSFLEFGFTPAANNSPVGAFFRLVSTSITGTSIDRGLDVYTFDYGTLTTADWRTPAQLAAFHSGAARQSGIASIQNASNLTVRAGLFDITQVDSAATLRYILSNSRNRLQQTPSGLEYNGFRSADFSGTDSDPALYVAEITNSRLNRSLGYQIQLSDGSHIYGEFDSTLFSNASHSVKHRTVAGVTTTIDTFTGQDERRGAQTYGVCRDDQDNFYTLNQSNGNNVLGGLAFMKGVGDVWTHGSGKSVTLPTYKGDINNVVCTWHPQGGTFGTIVALIGHRPADNAGTALTYALINVDHLVNGSGSFLRGSGNAEGLLVAATSTDGYTNFANETGTLMDISSGFMGSDTGFVMSTARHTPLSGNGGQSICRYTLNAGGTFATVWNFHDGFSGFSVKDANAKSRLMPLSGTQYVTANTSFSTDFGLVIKHRQQQEDQFTVLADVRLDAQGLASMPAATTLAVSNNWDTIHNPLDNKVWAYYFDATGDGRRLMRTHVDLNTGLAGQDEVEVSAAVGAAGSSNLAIRVHRHHTSNEQILITVANRTSGGTHSSIYVADNINVAPSQPTLLTRANYDATLAALFDWNFLDLNTGDTQSAFQLQIDNATTSATAWDTGKTVSAVSNYTLPASSLPNEQNWRWRVKTWDSFDVESPWSEYGFFTTSASGSVNITDPAVDNDPDIVTANYQVVWNVTGTTQDDYKVVVTRTDTGAILVDTGFVNSAVTQFLVEGMLSDIEWQVAVTVRDVSDIESNTALRLITPSYNAPEVPIVSFDIQDDGGYIQLNITNPEPVGDRPNPTTNQIQRRVFNAVNPDTPFQILGEADPNGTFKDFTAASGVLYEYRIRAVAGEFFTHSTITQADRELVLQGVWLHDPVDDEVTVRQFLFGKDNRSTSLDTISTTQQFAGRTFPVVDFGEHELEDIAVSVDIPNGPTHRTEEADLRAFMELKRTLFFRDNRGRAAYGIMSGYGQTDQAWGVVVGFKFARVSFDIEEA